MPEEEFKPEALESETAIRDAEEVKAQENAVSEATNKIGDAVNQAEVDNIKAEQAKLNIKAANATESLFREGGIDNVGVDDINKLNDKIEPAIKSGRIGDHVSTYKDVQTSTDPSIARARDAFNKAINSSSKLLSEKFSKILESKHPELKEQFNKITSDSQDIAKRMNDELNKPNPDPKVLNDLETELNAKQKEFEKLFDKADKISDEVESKKGGLDFKTILFFLGLFAGTLTFILLPKALTGCYVYYGSGLVNKLDGCSDYYNTDIDHQIQCRCGKSVDTPVPITSQICDTLDQSECTSPYCLGFCSKATYTPTPLPCEFPIDKNLNGRGLQCTTTASGDNYVYYAYRQVTLLSLLANVVNTIQNAPTYIEDFTKKILMYFLYGIGALFLLGIVLLFLKFAFSKLTESKPETQSTPAPSPAPVINTNPEALH